METHEVAPSFAEFLEMWPKFALDLSGDSILAAVLIFSFCPVVCPVFTVSVHAVCLSATSTNNCTLAALQI